jgi:hypothetical protein
MSPSTTSSPNHGPGADPKFEIRVPSHLTGGDFGCGVPKSPFVRPETGLGEGVTFAARRGREVAHLGPPDHVVTCGYFRDLWTEKSKLASMLVVWSPRGPRVP